jgi:hypothetical protein
MSTQQEQSQSEHKALDAEHQIADLKADLERAGVVFCAILAHLGGSVDLTDRDFRRAGAGGFQFDHAELANKGHRFTLKKPPLVVPSREMPRT